MAVANELVQDIMILDPVIVSGNGSGSRRSGAGRRESGGTERVAVYVQRPPGHARGVDLDCFPSGRVCEARNYRESARIRRTGATRSPARNDREAVPRAPSADDGFEVWVSEERAGQGGLREEAAHTGDWPKG